MKLSSLCFIVVMNVLFCVPFFCTSRSLTALIPRHVFFSAASYESPTISPNGSMIAYLASHGGVTNIWIRALDSADNDYQVTYETMYGIRHYFWAPDSSKLLYLQDTNGNEQWHLYCIDLITKITHDLTPFPHVSASIVAVENSIKDSILIALNKECEAYHDVYKLNLESGCLTMVAKNPGTVTRWLADRFLHVLCALRSNPNGGRDVIFRRNESAPWRTLISWSPLEVLSSSVVDISYDGTYLYCLNNASSDTVQLERINTLFHARKIIGKDEHYDVSGVLLDPYLRTIQAYTVIKQRKKFVILDTDFEKDFARLHRYDSGDISLVSRDAHDKKWIVAYVSDHGPIEYVLYDRDTHIFQRLFFNKPELNRYSLAPTEFVKIPTRDGLLLEGYCIKPISWNSSVTYPLIILVHGGPWSRDTWGYDMEAQWLANRGYIVLRVNFRGSTGYGKHFFTLGMRQWGGTMLNDIVDSAHWAIQNGLTDAQRIAVMGSSYGGYTALCAATMTDLFACAISLAGPSNLITLLSSLPPYYESTKKLLYSMIGDPLTDLSFLQDRSPLFHLSTLKVPLLIAQGLNDPRVHKNESDQIINELNARNLPYDYVLFSDEGHVLTHEKNRLIFYARVEHFLADVLHGSYESDLL